MPRGQRAKGDRWLVLLPVDDGSIQLLLQIKKDVSVLATVSRSDLRKRGLSTPLLREMEKQRRTGPIGLAFVTGVGSFTSARLVAAVMNTANLLDGVPIGIAARAGASYTFFASASPIRPTYARPANVTSPKKKRFF